MWTLCTEYLRLVVINTNVEPLLPGKWNRVVFMKRILFSKVFSCKCGQQKRNKQIGKKNGQCHDMDKENLVICKVVNIRKFDHHARWSNHQCPILSLLWLMLSVHSLECFVFVVVLTCTNHNHIFVEDLIPCSIVSFICWGLWDL